MKILCIGDLHLKDNLSYSEYVSDKRASEKKRILDYIIDQSVDCQHIVFLGDNFNSRNNSSETNREFVEFIERFKDKEIYIISGNHERKGNGKTAIDFLAEVKNRQWHIFTTPSTVMLDDKKLDFLPYLYNADLGVDNIKDAEKRILKKLEGGDILFAHHTISDISWNGIKSNTLTNEVVLSKKELEKRYKKIIIGHIHEPQQNNNVLVAGSVFTSEVGEHQKYIYKLELDDNSIEKIELPNRKILKLENPTFKELEKIEKDSIIKVILTDRKINVEELRLKLDEYSAYILIESYPSERKKIKIDNTTFDFSIESLLKIYAEEKEVDYQKLLKGLEIINNE